MALVPYTPKGKVTPIEGMEQYTPKGKVTPIPQGMMHDPSAYAVDERGVPTGSGEPVYQPKRTPAEKRQREARRDYSIPERIAPAAVGGLLNAARNTAVGTQALFNPQPAEERSPIGKAQAQFTAEKIDKALPEYKPEGTPEEIVSEIAEFAPGLFGGTVAAQRMLPQAVTLLGKAARLAAVGAAGAAGSAAITADPDTERLFVGEDAATAEVFKNVPGLQNLAKLGMDEQGTFNEQLFQKKFNLVTDTLIATGAVGSVLGAVKAAYNVVLSPVIRGIRGFVSESARNKEVFNRIIDIAADINESDGPEVRAAKIQLLRQHIEDNKDIIIKMSEVDPNVDDVTLQQDVLSSIKERLHPKDQFREREAVENLETSLTGEQTRATQRKLRSETKGAVEGLETSRGTPEEIKATGPRIVEEVEQQELKPFTEAITKGKQEVADVEQQIERLVQGDPTIKPALEAMEQGSTLDLYSPKQKAGVRIGETLKRVMKTVTDTKNRLFEEAVPEDLVARPNIMKDIDVILKSKALPKSFKEELKKAGNNYKKIVRAMNLYIEPEVRRLNQTSSSPDAKDLYMFVIGDSTHPGFQDKLLTTELEALVRGKKKGVGAARQAQQGLNKALDYYKRVFKLWDRNPTLRQIAPMLRSTDENIDELMRDQVSPTLLDPNLPYASGEIVDFLGRPSARDEGRNALRDFFNEDLVQTLRRKSLNKELTPDDLLSVRDQFARHLNVLRKVAPERAQEVEQLFDTLRNTSIDQKKRVEMIGKLEKALERERNIVFDTLLKDFMEDAPPEIRKALPGNFNSFKKLFTDEGGENRLDRIIQIVDQNAPELRQGIEGAYFRTLRDNLFKPGQDILNADNLNKFVEGESALARSGERLLGPEYVSKLKQLFGSALNIVNRETRRQQQIVDYQASKTKGGMAINTLITWVFGVLNPKAARIRTVTGSIVKRSDQEDTLKNFVDLVLSSPDEFLKAVDQYVMKGPQLPLSNDDRTRLLNLMIRQGFVSDRNETQRQTDEVLQR